MTYEERESSRKLTKGNDMSNLEKYGFKPHGADDSSTTAQTEKTVSCKVNPEVWGRWKKAQQRLAAHGEIELAAVVRSAFLKALDELESDADQLDGIATKGKAK